MNTGLSAIDSYAILIVAVGLVIVFAALILIYGFFKAVLPFILSLPYLIRKRFYKNGNGLKPAGPVQADFTAAAALTVYLYFSESHDDESNVITIKRVSKTYSPWSSKIYGLNRRLN